MHGTADGVRSDALEQPDVETSSDGYAARFAGPAGRYMLGVQEAAVRSMLADLPPGASVLDVGGGHGQLLALMLDAAPAADGVLLEQPSLIGPAEKHLGEAGVLDRCRLVGGSFFETAPDDGDLYVLRRVVHDFDHEQGTAVLGTLRRHVPDHATLLLMENVVPPGNEAPFAK